MTRDDIYLSGWQSGYEEAEREIFVKVKYIFECYFREQSDLPKDKRIPDEVLLNMNKQMWDMLLKENKIKDRKVKRRHRRGYDVPSDYPIMEEPIGGSEFYDDGGDRW